MKKLKIIFTLVFCLCLKTTSGQELYTKESTNYKGFNLSQEFGLLSKYTSSKSNNFNSNFRTSLNNNNVTDYDFHGKIAASMSIAEAFCSDLEGNIYITGKSGNIETKSGDITVIKVNSSGEIIWTLQLPSTEFTVNSGTSIAIDENGFLYVLGYTWNQMSTDIVCMKISSSGEMIWQRLLGETSTFQLPTALHISESGDILISGISYQESNVTYYISKLNSEGSLLWQYIDNEFPTQTWNEPVAISTDNNNNVIVTGTGFDDGLGSKIVTIKFSSSGSVIWRVLKNKDIVVDNELIATDIFAKDLVVDEQNNIYITSNYSKEILRHSLTLKYNSNGFEDWDFIHESLNETIILENVEIQQGQLFVGGYHYQNNEDGFILYNLNINGSQNWVQNTIEDLYFQSSFTMTFFNENVFLDAVYMNLETGDSYLRSKKYQISSGDLIQSNAYSFNNVQSGFSLNNFVKPVISDNSKSVVLSPLYSELGNIIQVIQLDSLQINVNWDLKYSPQNSIRANIYETVSDSNSNTYSIVSKFYVNPDNLNTVFQKSYIVKYNSSGNLEDSVELDNSEGLTTIKLSIDQSDHLILLKRNFSSENVSLIKMSPILDEVWNINFPLNSISSEKVLLDSQNNIYIITSEPSSIQPESSNVAIRKYSSIGELLFVSIYQSTDVNILKSIPTNCKLNTNGNLLIAGLSTDGSSAGFNFNYQPFLLNVTSGGSLVFFEHFPIANTTSTYVDLLSLGDETLLVSNTENISSGIVEVYSFKVNSTGNTTTSNNYSINNTNIYMQKILHSTSTNRIFYVTTNLSTSDSNIQLTSWDEDGSLLNTFDFESNIFFQDAYLDSQNVYVLAQSQNNLNFPFRLLNWIGPFIYSTVTKVTHDLNLSENLNLVGTNYSLFEPKQFIPLSNLNLLISGRLFHEELFFEGLQFFSIPYEPELNIPSVPKEVKNIFYCYPNPSKGKVFIASTVNNETISKILIYDINGRFIKEFNENDYQVYSNSIELDISDLQSGVYLVRVLNESTFFGAKLIKE